MWCAFIYSSDHRCILNVICDGWEKEREKGKPVTMNNISLMRNHLNLATELANGFLISFDERKAEKLIYIRMNPNFFSLLPKLMEMIKAKINPELEKIRQFNPQEKKKFCTFCRVEKTESELRFMGATCDCASPNFVDIKQDLDKKARLEQIEKLLEETITRRRKIEELEALIVKIQREKREQKEKKLSEFEQFCEKFNLGKSSQEASKVEKNYETLTEAFRLYAPKTSYSRNEELKRIQEGRMKKVA